MNCSSSNFLPYDTTDVDNPSLSEILKEINETPENRTRCLEILRKDLKKLKDIEACLEENVLLSFLRVSKYDTAKAIQRVINYYKQFDAYLEAYRKLTFSFDEIDRIRHLKLSPYRCHDNSFLLLAKGSIDYKKFGFAPRFYLEIITLHTILENPVNQICGGTYIFDYEGLDIHGYLAFTPFWLRLFTDSLMNTFPCRMKGVHIVNTPSFFPFVLKVCFRFASKKMQNRVFLYKKNSDWKDLHSRISPDILPEKYGGKLKEEELIDCLDNFKEDEERVLNFFAFGNIATKTARQTMRVFR